MSSGRVHRLTGFETSEERQRPAQLPARDRFVRRNEARQFRPQIVVEPFVGVDAEDPRLAGLIERELLLPGIAEPWLMDEPDRQPAALEVLDDGERAVGRAGIDDDDLR